MTAAIVLSLFPGADLLGRGFEQAGFCVVRGPDRLLGQSIEGFRCPPGVFSGIIGGPPCQDFSRARRRPPTGHGREMLLEFLRIVAEARPHWFLIENVPGVPSVSLAGYRIQRFNLFASDYGLAQKRNRAFQFGSVDGLPLILMRTRSHFGRSAPAALAKDPRRLSDLCELQGLPRDFDLPGLCPSAKKRAVGNGVPVPMARAVAEAIRDRRPVTLRLCLCGCGRVLDGPQRQRSATVACRKRLERGASSVTTPA